MNKIVLSLKNSLLRPPGVVLAKTMAFVGIFLFVFAQNSLTAAAITQAQRDTLKSGARYFNTEEEGSSGIGPADSCMTILYPSINDENAIASAIDEFIRTQYGTGSPFIGFGKYIVESAKNNGINPFIVIAVGHNESHMGTDKSGVAGVESGHNAFGRSADSQPNFYYPVSGGPDYWYKWGSWQDSIDDNTFPNTNSEQNYIRERYVNQESIADLFTFAAFYLTGSKTGAEDRAGNRVTDYYNSLVDIYRSLIEKSGSAISCDATSPEGGTPGNVDVSGYAFPVAPQRKSQNGGVPAMSPLPCGAPTSCHHPFTAPGSYAFDISRQPGGDAAAGTPVYAISGGKLDLVHPYVYNGQPIPGCWSLQLQSDKDNFWYWYGHLQKPLVRSGQSVKAGQQLAEIGVRKCTGNGSSPHLHIDRGCIENGVPQKGGREECRDPGIVPLINQLFNNLPE
ncbi:peptidoglycan DD-metalloendopeptidase family protein [Candidatus Saccharibacteria bacterium]|nr:peptidoglycan DD-metalloendopeptidase family protein [Candidatus Saccharibacteria bacterium]MBI2285407.1 peptidoglycan DD-metalloendopeptidase family protein [Candidatus Saccharibacteria bacterium]